MNRFKPFIFFTFSFLLVLSYTSFGQDSLTPSQFAPIKISRKIARDPKKLAAFLTNDKTGEKEKFDAIFTWVVFHMHYDYKKYKRGKAFANNRPIKRIIRSHKGLCLDFAHVMDSLCAYAGLHNTTVEGYVKEFTFDIHDTLYMGNHAWNAVKLDGYWYLYDATWCSGYVELDYTKFGKWRQKIVDTLLTKRKPFSYYLIKEGRRSKYCGNTSDTILGSYQGMKIKWFPFILSEIIDWPRYRLKTKYRSVANTKYYLANPELFGVTHYPDFAPWDLTRRLSTVTDFSQDSAFYLNEHIKGMPNIRGGRFCLECDNIAGRNELERLKMTFDNTPSNNPKNHFIPGLYYLEMSQKCYNKALNTRDSLTKMQLLDSTLSYSDSSRLEFKLSKRNSSREYRNIQLKERTKRRILEKDNQIHRRFANKYKQKLVSSRIRMSNTRRASKSYHKRNVNFKEPQRRAVRLKVKPKKLNAVQTAKLKADQQQQLKSLDSLNNLIRWRQETFDKDLVQLWQNLLYMHGALRPLFNGMYRDSYGRIYFKADDYDLVIRTIRNQLREDLKITEDSLNVKLIWLTDSLRNNFSEIAKMTRKRNSLAVKSIKTHKQLAANGLISRIEEQNFIESCNEGLKDAICWNESLKDLMEEVNDYYGWYKNAFRDYERVVIRNSGYENKRLLYSNRQANITRSRQQDAINKNNNAATQLRDKAKQLKRKVAKKQKQ